MKRNLQHITILILATLLSMLAGNSFAQISPVNTGDDPYLGTTHSYLVVIDDPINNDYGWQLINGSTIYDPSDDFITATLVGNNYTIEIEFTRADFTTTPATWTLRYEETSRDDGSCVAIREYTIHLKENEFYESLYDIASETPPGAFSACHDSTNTIQQYDDVNGLNFQTAYIFPVYMYKESDFKLATWHFDAGLSISGTGYSIVTVNKASGSTNLGAAYTISESGGKYIVVADSATGNYESDYVELRVVLTGPMFNNADLTLEIESAYAISGSTGQVVTEDNVHIYPDEPGVAWRTKTVTINGVPATRDITFGAGETAWSAQYPLQNSTHNYTVQMGNTGNTRSWQIIDNTGAEVDGAVYVLDEAISGTNSEAEFTFNMDPGAYTLVFTETSGNGCISIRHYPIVLGGPFVVSIAEVADRCATASGNIYPGLQQTDTEISYAVTLNTSNYYANWEFEFDVASNLGFADPDLTYTVSSVSTGASYSTGLVSVSNSQASPLTVVQVVVTYTGHYENEHTITAGVSNATGSFNESSTDVSEEHIIHAMPQAGTLAGVE